MVFALLPLPTTVFAVAEIVIIAVLLLAVLVVPVVVTFISTTILAASAVRPIVSLLATVIFIIVLLFCAFIFGLFLALRGFRLGTRLYRLFNGGLSDFPVVFRVVVAVICCPAYFLIHLCVYCYN